MVETNDALVYWEYLTGLCEVGMATLTPCKERAIYRFWGDDPIGEDLMVCQTHFLEIMETEE